MKHLFYGFLYIFTLTFVDSGLLTVFLIPILVGVFVSLRTNRIQSEPDQSASPIVNEEAIGPKTSCVLTTPEITTGSALPAHMTNGTVGSGPRRQRSLRERAGIDGRLDKLHQPSRSAYLAPSPSVTNSIDAEFSRPVRKCDFAEHVRFMAQDADARFLEEYQDLSKVGRGQPCTAADSAHNRPKNRFANILPYDHSRVKLTPIDEVEGSDYINASYISGYNGPKEFISTQGPLPTTRDDFWRMVWEQNSIAIINLTRCLEKGREKCDQYWPTDSEALEFGNIRVSLINEIRLPFGTIRELKIIRKNDDQPRTLTHFHFTAWPDFGVPERPQTLVKFVRAFRSYIPPSDHRVRVAGPVIVHCSAGVGRSGTLIAIDRILQHLQYHEHVDVYGVVYEMRKERFWMVQTEQQYIFIHHCLLCVLESREDDDDHSPTVSNSNSPMTEIAHGLQFTS